MKKAGVFGLGKSGLASVRWLKAQGATVYAWDDSEAGRHSLLPLLFQGEGAQSRNGEESSQTPSPQPSPSRERGKVGIHLLPIHEWPWAELDFLSLAPGVPLTHPKPHPVVEAAQKAGVPVICDVELLYCANPRATYIGITGTNGKSTTTALIGHILTQAGQDVAVGGNLGTAALDLPMGKAVYVLELSSYQLDLLDSFHANVAVWLNITPDHLGRHGGLEGYVAAKRRLFRHMTGEDMAVIGVDDAHSQESWLQCKEQGIGTVPVSVHKQVQGLYVEDGWLVDATGDAPRKIMELSTVERLRGVHNWQNMLMAFGACRAAGVAEEVILAGIRSFPGLAHRQELVAVKGSVRFINDSKATNADATSKALASYEDIYWILGGQPKEGGIAGLEAYYPQIRHAFLIGQAEAEFAKALEGEVSYMCCGDLANATRQAAAMAERAGHGVVLLSPACASFDQWPNFEARGDAFRQMVLQSIGGISCNP